MATARCETCGPPQGLKYNYPHMHTLVPPSSIFCGATACTRHACAWLTDAEEEEYLRGERKFRLLGYAIDVLLI
jgi:hypothetical protein